MILKNSSFQFISSLKLLISSLFLFFYHAFVFGENDDVYMLPNFDVINSGVANIRSSSTYESLVSNLDFDPRIDFQSRNMAEAQGDVSIRGGIFEGTGVVIGSASILDPQTGHYSTELPIAPEMITGPEVLTGIDNTLRGFNSTSGTLEYKWKPMVSGGNITLGVGGNFLNFQRFHSAFVERNLDDSQIGYEIEHSRSRSDGTIKFSDHDFNRTTARIQLLSNDYQTDLFAGYQSKFFGQYGMYTGDLYTAYDPYETEYIKTALFIFNHRKSYNLGNHWEFTSYFRKNNDHYIFNRFNPNNDFVHETKVFSIASSGLFKLGENFSVHYSSQIAKDQIKSSALENGNFTDRTYTKLSLVPEFEISENINGVLSAKLGFALNDSNRNSSELSPLAEISYANNISNGLSRSIYLSYSEGTQLIGYGAIGGSETSGLFRSNHDLLRETSRNVEIGINASSDDFNFNSCIFYRKDLNLIDWVYTGSNLFAREAENVDIKNRGFEIVASKAYRYIQLTTGYSFLDKSEDYGNPNVVGSFYALNFPKHRTTLGLVISPNNLFRIRIDNEWRQQYKNALRSGPDNGFFSHLSISYYPQGNHDIEFFSSYDKSWKKNFQEIPGTPGRGDQLSIGLSYNW